MGTNKITTINMTCDKCGANLDVDIEHLQAYCPYCGTKLLIDVSQMSDIINKKEQTKQKEMKYDHNYKILNTILDYRERKNIQRDQERNKTGIFAMVFMIVLLLFCALMALLSQ